MEFTNIDYAVLTYAMGIYIAIVISPGPNFALVARLALRGQRLSCCGAIAGLASAATLYATLTMVGLAALLAQIGWLAWLLQVAGGLYLIYLGLLSWRASSIDSSQEGSDRQTAMTSFSKGFRVGTLVNLSNPKAIAFFVGLYAVAIPQNASLETRIAVLVGGAVIEFTWYSIVCSILSHGAFRRLYQIAAKWIERAIGFALIAFGAVLLLRE